MPIFQEILKYELIKLTFPIIILGTTVGLNTLAWPILYRNVGSDACIYVFAVVKIYSSKNSAPQIIAILSSIYISMNTQIIKYEHQIIASIIYECVQKPHMAKINVPPS